MATDALGMLAGVLVTGLAGAGLSLVVRALVPTHWLLQRPWGCNLCMSTWSALLASMTFRGCLVDQIEPTPATVGGFALSWLGALPIAYLLLDRLWTPPMPKETADTPSDIDIPA